jgi:hypothetical protein
MDRVEKALAEKSRELETKTIVVSDQDTYDMAVRMGVEAKATMDEIDAYFDPDIKKAYELHRSLTKKKSDLVTPLQRYRKRLSDATTEYLQNIRRKQALEQQRLDDQRREQERKEKEKLEKQAAKAEAKGNVEKAEDIRQKKEEVYIPPAIVAPTIPKSVKSDVGTTTIIDEIDVSVVDEIELLKAVIEKRVPAYVVEISVPKLRKFVKVTQLKELSGCIITTVPRAQTRRS